MTQVITGLQGEVPNDYQRNFPYVNGRYVYNVSVQIMVIFQEFDTLRMRFLLVFVEKGRKSRHVPSTMWEMEGLLMGLMSTTQL